MKQTGRRKRKRTGLLIFLFVLLAVGGLLYKENVIDAYKKSYVPFVLSKAPQQMLYSLMIYDPEGAAVDGKIDYREGEIRFYPSETMAGTYSYELSIAGFRDVTGEFTYEFGPVTVRLLAAETETIQYEMNTEDGTAAFQEPVDITFTERNQADFELRGLFVGHNGTVEQAEIKEERTKEGSRFVSRYTVGAETFREEGVYELFTVSTDENGQQSRSPVYRVIVDGTAPIVTGSDNGREWEIRCQDNTAVAELCVFSGGGVIKALDERELADADGVVTVLQQRKNRKITVIATDIAGNETVISLQKKGIPLWGYGAAILAVFVLAGIGGIEKRKKR